MAFFKSEKIKAFPCTYRGKDDRGNPFNPEAKLNTEANYALLGKLGAGFDRTSYIISWDYDVLKVVLGGYYFEIEATREELKNASGFDTYLHIHLLDKTIVSGTYTTTVLKDLSADDYNYNSLDSEIGDDYYFTGLEYVINNKTPDSDENDIYLAIYEEDNIRYDNFLPILNTLNEETKGLNVPFLEIFDKSIKVSETNSTANWVSKHVSSGSDLIKIEPVENNDEEKCDYTAEIDLAFDLKNGIKYGTCNELAVGSTAAGYYPVDAVKAAGSLNKPILAVNIPNNNNWRPIQTDDGIHLDGSERGAALHLKSGDNVTVRSVHQYTDGGTKSSIVISATDSYIDSAYKNGLKINKKKYGNAVDLYIPYANTTTAGVGIVTGVDNTNISINGHTAEAERNYGVRIDKGNKLYVNIPWINHTDDIVSIKRRLENLEADNDRPWTEEPYIEIYKDGSKLDSADAYISPKLIDTYTIRVYYNSVSNDQTIEDTESKILGSKLVKITATAKNNRASFASAAIDTTSNPYNASGYMEFKLKASGANFDDGSAKAETFTFDIKYTLTTSGEVITKTLIKDIDFYYPLPYHTEPEIIVHTPDGSDFSERDLDGTAFKSLNDTLIRVFPYIDKQWVDMRLLNEVDFEMYWGNDVIYKTYPTAVEGVDQRSDYRIALNKTVYEEDADGVKWGVKYWEFKLDSGLYIPEGLQGLKVGFKLNYLSENNKVLQTIKDKELIQELHFDFGYHKPTEYWIATKTPSAGWTTTGSLLSTGNGTSSNPFTITDLGQINCVRGVGKELTLNTYPNYYNNVKVSEIKHKWEKGSSFNVISALPDSSVNPSKTVIQINPFASLSAGVYTDNLIVTVIFQHPYSKEYPYDDDTKYTDDTVYFKLPIEMNVSLPVQTSGTASKTTTTIVTGSGTTTATTNTTTGTTTGGTTHGGGGCFEAGTKVLMADGTTKNIEEVNRGEIVKSFNVYTNKFENSMVVKRHKIKLEDDLVLLTFSDGTKLQTTTTHPFYTTNGWVSLRPDYHYNMHEDIADDYFEMMTIGQKFYKVDSENNKINLVGLTRIQYRHGVSHNHYVYNLDVTGANTFFAEGILGHNARDKNIVQNNGNNFYFL